MIRTAVRRLLILAALLAVFQPAAAPAGASAPAALQILLINQDASDWPAISERRGALVASFLRHFPANVTKLTETQYAAGTALAFSHIVVVGNDALRPLPEALIADLTDLTRLNRPILWVGYGLAQLPPDVEQALGFSPGYWTGTAPAAAVEYRGQRYDAHATDYSRIDRLTPAVQVVATYAGEAGDVPYIVRSGPLWYVNGLPDVTGGDAADAADADAADAADTPALILADVLHDFLGVEATEKPQALIWLEDVSVHLDPARLLLAVDILASQRVPFALALTPAQRHSDGRVISLRERPALVGALRHAQARGATVVVQGDPFARGGDRGADAAGATSIRTLRDLDIEPRLWLSPYGAAQRPAGADAPGIPYFSHAAWASGPGRWLPYPSGPDEYGQPAFPGPDAALGAPETPDMQVEQARRLRIVRDGWVVGRFSPETAQAAELEALVTGLRHEGYTFVDLRAQPTKVRSDYQPGLRVRVATWLSIDRQLLPAALDEGLTRQVPWWPAARRLPWIEAFLSGSVGFFLVRLREQWRPAPPAARSLVETAGKAGRGARRWRLRGGPVWLPWALLTAGAVALAVGGLAASQWSSVPGRRNLAGWSELPWRVAYDGYGSVRVTTDGLLVLAPQAPRRPGETHAALTLAGDRDWRDYSFSVLMSTQAQLRQNSPPNPWETGWLFFRYEGAQRSYYLAHKTNGVELGKLSPTAHGGQIFLVTTPDPPAELGRWYAYRIEVSGATIRVYIDGQPVLTYTDPEPITGGGVGLYTEDARVSFGPPVVNFADPARPQRPAATPARVASPPAGAALAGLQTAGANLLPARVVPAAVPAAPLRRVYDTTFDDAHAGWPDDPQGTAWLADGALRLHARQPSHFVAVGAPASGAAELQSGYRDVVVSARFRKVGGGAGGGYGLIVRDEGAGPRDGINQTGQFYVFEVSDRGELGIWRRDGERWVDLLSWTPSGAVRPGGAPNELVAWAVGRHLTFVVNGVLAASLEDTTLTAGGVGVFVGGDFNEVALDHFTVELPAAGAP